MIRLLRILLVSVLAWGLVTLALFVGLLQAALPAGWAGYAQLELRALLWRRLGMGDDTLVPGDLPLSAAMVHHALAPYLDARLAHFFSLAGLMAAGLVLLLACSRWWLLKPGYTDRYKRGARIVSARQLNRQMHGLLWARKAAQGQLINLGGVYWPRQVETQHLLISGATGAGKSTAFMHLLQTVRGRGERAIIADPGGEYLARFYRPGVDRILNPFDARCDADWNLFNELRRDYDPHRFAQSIIPEGEGSSREWHIYAQKLLANTMQRLIERGEMTMATLADWLTLKPIDELGLLLTGMEMAQITHSGNEKMAANTRAILGVYLNVFRYIRPGTFSIRQWIETDGTGWLFLPYTDAQFGVLQQMIACWFDIAISAGLDLPADPHRRLWFILDEMDSLRLPTQNLVQAMTRLRKHGGVLVGGLQSLGQLRAKHDKDNAQTILANFSTRLVLKAGDEDTAESLSKELGQRELDRLEESLSLGAKPESGSNSWSLKRVEERLVLSSELRKLPDLSGYLDVTGPWPIARVQIEYLDPPKIAPAFCERHDLGLLAPLSLSDPDDTTADECLF